MAETIPNERILLNALSIQEAKGSSAIGADGFAEREAAKVVIKDTRQAAPGPDTEVTLGANKAYDAQQFVQACLDMDVTSHVAQNPSGRRSAVPDAIAASDGYALWQRKRKVIEQGFGWENRPEVLSMLTKPKCP